MRISKLQEEMNQIQKEIEQARNQITTYSKRKDQAQKLIDNHAHHDLTSDVDEIEEDDSTLIDRIYTETKKKAAAAGSFLMKGNGRPLYLEPDDLESVHDILKKHKTFRIDLVKKIRKERAETDTALQNINAQYEVKRSDWLKKVDEWEKSQKKTYAQAESNPESIEDAFRNRDVKHREIFEKTFPDLKKKREEEERSGRTADRNSELLQPSDEDIKARTAAAIPPLLRPDAPEARLYFHNNNGISREPKEEHKARQEEFLNSWTEEEKQIFVDRLVHYGKNFAAVSLFLPNRASLGLRLTWA
ncbi:hypothetical protein L596_030608 [Steinernema carpocapsae]|uniref:SANT domain-containing protein n=1 Tax=Steinernema carpocapsae TaxID=34508 RepID=A0A4U5LPY7_STECR|nr:hypothetical protein L596_030608 [Steinernema carpocapsae]